MTDSEKEKAKDLIAENKRAFVFCLQQAEKSLASGALLSGAVWAQIAADVAFHKHAGIFCSPRLEAVLLKISGRLDEHKAASLEHESASFTPVTKPRMFHVMTNAFSTGGHTRLVERLAGLAESHEHFLVTTAQRGELPERLKRTFCAGTINWLDLSTPRSDLLTRSLRLRRICRQYADVIVVHSHPFDVVPTLAFGVPGGAPVIVLNHSDHTFWVGASVADVVSELRLAGQELSFRRRQSGRSCILPIPLVGGEPYSPQARCAARERLGLPEDAAVLLTIASPYKYTAMGEYDFLKAARDILGRHEKAILIACGPDDSGAWKDASNAVDGRLRAYGIQSDVALFHAAADIYLDPFPVASLTSWLETALCTVPVLGRANPSASIFSDGSVIEGDGWTHAVSYEEYLELAGRLITDPNFRADQGGKLREQVIARHLMPAWGGFLEQLLAALPETHAVRQLEVREEALDDSDFILATIANITSGRRSVNTSLRKHGGCFPAIDRWQLFIKGLLGKDGIRLLPFSTYTGRELFS